MSVPRGSFMKAVEAGSPAIAWKRPLGRRAIRRSSISGDFKVSRGSIYLPSCGDPLYVTTLSRGGRSYYEAGSCGVTLTGTYLWHPINMLAAPQGFLDDDEMVRYRRSGWGYVLSSGSVEATIGLRGLNQVRVATPDRVLADFPIRPMIRLSRTRSEDDNRLLSAVLGSGLVHHIRFGADVLRGNLWIPESLVDAVLSRSRRDELVRATCLGPTRSWPLGREAPKDHAFVVS